MFRGKLSEIVSKDPALQKYPETVRRGLAWLAQTPLHILPMGKLVLDGEQLFVNKQEYVTKAPEEVILESHRKYVDIQFMLCGREWMGWCPCTPKLPVQTPYDEEKDVMFYPPEVMPFWASGAASPQKFELSCGEFAIFAPEDVHASQIYVEKPETVQKIVVKCRV
ncbi:MAG: YhcH/YjgK/YiaL family protein [Planctomycetia bacterium]|nr:YhcH/YjgK/YiaL family protein [Planctomycetia bacterium]